MKINKRQLRRIIQEWTKEEQELGIDMGRTDSQVKFEWDPSGLAMGMYVDGRLATKFYRQEQVKQLINQLEELLAGPMRTAE